jgi:hypothetical protein
MFTINSSFIGSFKLGDNIHYNIQTLAPLYTAFNQTDANTKRMLCKPIILVLVSVLEAVMHDFYNRIRFHTVEGIKNLPYEVANAIRAKQIDKFEHYIVSARKYNLFDMTDTRFYDRLDDLRRLRNRVHIQNIKKDFEPDDYKAFNEQRKLLAERALEKTLKTMAEKYPRGENFHYVPDFELPWDEHFPG